MSLPEGYWIRGAQLDDASAVASVLLADDVLDVGSGTLVPVGETVIRSWGVVHPEHRGLGVGSALLERIWARAAERLRGAEGARFHHSITDVDEAARAMVLDRGFAFVRSFRHMQIDLQGTPDPRGSTPRHRHRRHRPWGRPASGARGVRRGVRGRVGLPRTRVPRVAGRRGGDLRLRPFARLSSTAPCRSSRTS